MKYSFTMNDTIAIVLGFWMLENYGKTTLWSTETDVVTRKTIVKLADDDMAVMFKLQWSDHIINET